MSKQKQTVVNTVYPSYEITAPYPGSPFYIGDIITLTPEIQKSMYLMDGRAGLHEDILDKYPNIFKKLTHGREES